MIQKLRYLKRTPVIVIAILLLCLVSAPKVFASPSISEFNITSGSEPFGITEGADGNIWFADRANNTIGEMTSSGILLNEYTVPTSSAGLFEITTGSDGNVWFTEDANKIGKITPSGVITEYSTGLSSNAQPQYITDGADGNVWFSELNYGKVGKITPSGTITEYAIPGAMATTLGGITSGPNGNVWVTNDGAIDEITPSGTVTSFSTGSVDANVIIAGPDGNLWFNDWNHALIAKMTPTGTITTYTTPTDSNYYGMGAGPDGNVWFSDSFNNEIGVVTPSGTVTEYPTPNTSSGPAGITSGPNGNVWFAEQGTDIIGEINLNLPVTTSTLANAVNAANVVVTTPNSTNITCSTAVKETSLAKQDSSYSYPLGLINLCFNTPTTNNQVNVTFVTNLTPFQVVARDFNSATQTYVTIPGSTITETTHNGQPALELTYTVADNGPLDSNSATGYVTDPVGLAVPNASTASSTPDTGYGSPHSNELVVAMLVTGFVSLVFGLFIYRRSFTGSKQ